MLFTVLGAKGFVGSRVTAYLRAGGHDVQTPDRGDAGVFDSDLGRVIYAIGLTADFRQRPFDTVEAHVCYLGRVLRNARYTSLTYLSSARVYQGSESGAEDSALRVFPDADGLYNLTKLTGEALCLQSGRCQVARLTNIVGEGASESFIEQLIATARIGKIQLHSSLQSSKDYLLVEDAVRALAVLASGNKRGIYNVGSGKNTSTAAILKAMSTRLKFETIVDDASAEITFPVIRTEKISALLSWQPTPVTGWLETTALLDAA